MTGKARGRVHSFQSLGAVDGPGVRFVVFLRGCNLRCACCHNPETHDVQGGEEYTAEEVIAKAKRYKEYFGSEGGITLSGGEPILQADFAREIFELAHNAGINTCLDSSGSILNDKVKALLSVTDRVLLDIKYTSEELYRLHVGCSLELPMKFLRVTEELSIPTTVRQVTIPTLNDTEEDVVALVELVRPYSTVDGIELLPFRKICEMKYEKLEIRFPHGELPEPTAEKMAELKAILKRNFKK